MTKKWLQTIGLGVVIALIMALMAWRGLGTALQHRLQNQFYDTDQASDRIVIVAIDEKSLKELGALSQWPRGHYARAIEALEQAGVDAIGVDVTFPDERAGDETLAQTLKKYDNVVLAARYYFEQGKSVIELPNDALRQANRPRLGWINVKLDPDGFVRQIPAAAGVRGIIAAQAFALEIARVARADMDDLPTFYETDPVTGDSMEFMYVNYFGAPHTFPRVSMADIMNERPVDPYGERVDMKGKIALIGPTAIDLQDHYLSPVSEGIKMPGVEIHANAIQTVLSGRFLSKQPAWSLWLTVLILLAANLALFSVSRVRYALPIAVVEAVGAVIAGIFAYEFGLLVNVVYPALTVILTFVGVFLLRFIREQKQRRFVEGAFGHYVSQEVVEQIIRDPSLLELGGAKREITTFFSDIAGFTTFSEKMKPEELVAFLNEYLEAMTTIILAHDGTLDKYEGDAIMAFWGAPIAMEDHAKKACLAALECQRKLAELRGKWAREGKPEVRVRIGLNTGEAVVGNMGSADRFDYTAMGDNVNLASRLEGINKQYGTEIMASGSTFKAAGQDFAWREVDVIRVKGKKEPVHIYELAGDRQTKGAPDYNQALELYRDRQFKKAKKRFAALTDDPAARVFTERCEAFLKNPPPKGWDGVWNFEVK